MIQQVKIVLVTDSLPRGGAERQLALLAEHLQAFGYVTSVVVLYDDGWWSDYLIGKGIDVECMGFKAPPLINRRIVGPFLKLVKKLKSEKPDIVISNLYRASIWTAIASRIAGVPIVISRRGDCGFVRSLNPFPRLLERCAIRFTDYFVAVSQAVAEETRLEGVPAKKIGIVYNGVELPSEDKHQPSNEVVTIGFLAKMASIKDPLTLIRALKIVANQFPSIMCKIAGSDGGCEKEVRSEISKLCLEGTVIFTGAIEDTTTFLRSIDIGVLCSRTEGFPNTILEYMAFAKPVIATNVGGVTEVVIDGETGFLFEPGDYEKLAEALLKLINDRPTAAKMGLAGQKRVAEMFSIPGSMHNWNNLIQKLLAAKSV